jgi:hypothetical protein
MSHWDVDLDEYFSDVASGKRAVPTILSIVIMMLILTVIVSCVAISLFSV